MWQTIISAVSAIGTVGACIISLWLARQTEKHKLDCVFVWGIPNEYKPTLIVKNLCRRTIIIDKVDVFYAHKQVASINCFSDYKMKEYAVIYDGERKQIELKTEDFHFPNIKENNADKQRKKTLKIVVHTSSGKRFVSKHKFTDRKLLELLFGYALFQR